MINYLNALVCYSTGAHERLRAFLYPRRFTTAINLIPAVIPPVAWKAPSL
jgi:hypothetical protein